jgi:hypothetical protein
MGPLESTGAHSCPMANDPPPWPNVDLARRRGYIAHLANRQSPSYFPAQIWYIGIMSEGARKLAPPNSPAKPPAMPERIEAVLRLRDRGNG